MISKANRIKREPDPSISGMVSGLRAAVFRARQFTARHRTMVSLATALILICYTFLAAGVQAAHAAEQGSDVLASFKDALVDISGEGADGSGRTLLESTHFLAWDRWTGFSPSGGTYYLVSAGSALSTATNFISSLFFSVSGFILKATGLVAAIGLSFDAVFSLMGMITRNFRLVYAMVVPGARADFDRVCAVDSQECGVLNSATGGNIIALILIIAAIVVAYKVTKDRRESKEKREHPIMANGLGRQVILSATSMLLFFSMGSASLAGNGTGLGSPTWYARGAEWVATQTASLIGEGTNFTSMILTGRSLKTGPAVGGACSDYIGAMHTVFQSGKSASSSRDQFLVALDELALNSYFRLVVNSSYGSVDDSSFSGAGNAWCHRLETDAGVSGAEHMLLTRIALAQNNKEVAESTSDFTKYPLAASIDTNVASMISGSDIERFAASRAISNMWGPYTSTDSSNEAAFYFAACNVSSPKPKLLETWGDVISADAIKTAKGLQTGGDDGGGDPGISIPIGGTTTSKIYLDGSRTLADIDASLSDAGGLCGAIPAGSVVRDPALSKGTSGVDLFSYIGATGKNLAANVTKNIPLVGLFTGNTDHVQDAVDQQNKRNNEIQQGWKNTGYRSAGDKVMSSAPDSAVNYAMLSEWKKQADDLGSVSFSSLNSTKEGSIAVAMYNGVAQADPDGNDDAKTLTGILFAGSDSADKAKDVIKTGFGIEDADQKLSTYIAGLKDSQAAKDKDGKDGKENKVDKADAGRLAAKAAITGFTGSGFSTAQSMNFREPDVEFLGMGIKKMSSAAPLFAAAIETGPYDYYLAVIGGNTVSTLVTSVCALILSVAIAYFLLPIVIGIVLSKLLAVMAWFTLPFTLLINIIPNNRFRSMLKISAYSILWAHISTAFFTAVLKVLSMMIAIFNSILYNPSHPVIIQTVEIMFAILAAFGIMKFILKQYFKIDFTSFKGAMTGATLLSGKAIFDSIGKPLGLIKKDDEAFENASSKGDLKKALASLFNRDDKGEDEEEQKKADDNLTNVKDTDESAATNEAAPENEADDEDQPTGKELIKKPGGSIAKNLMDTLLEGSENYPPDEELTDEQVREVAEAITEDLAEGAGILHTDTPATPEEARRNFKAALPENALPLALEAMEKENRSVVEEAFNTAELGGFGTDSEKLDGTSSDSIFDPATGGGIRPENTYTAVDGQDALGYNNKLYAVLDTLGDDLSEDDRRMLERASEISSRLNSPGNIPLPTRKEAAWLDEHQARLDELFELASVDKVNSRDLWFSGSGRSRSNEPVDNPAKLIADAIDRNTEMARSLSQEGVELSAVERMGRHRGELSDKPYDPAVTEESGVEREIKAAATGINERLERLSVSVDDGFRTHQATLEADPALKTRDVDSIISALNVNSDRVEEKLQELVDQGESIQIDGETFSPEDLQDVLDKYMDRL